MDDEKMSGKDLLFSFKLQKKLNKEIVSYIEADAWLFLDGATMETLVDKCTEMVEIWELEGEHMPYPDEDEGTLIDRQEFFMRMPAKQMLGLGMIDKGLVIATVFNVARGMMVMQGVEEAKPNKKRWF